MSRLIFVLALLAAPAFSAETPLSAEQAQGKALFNTNCTYCHSERGHATTLLSKRVGPEKAQLERRANLAPELIRHAVRHGINSMPWFRRAELSDADLQLISTYLTRAQSAP
jgi:mono/diheme cytochrome c family protein